VYKRIEGCILDAAEVAGYRLIVLGLRVSFGSIMFIEGGWRIDLLGRFEEVSLLLVETPMPVDKDQDFLAWSQGKIKVLL
jgi:hypothetical protein